MTAADFRSLGKFEQGALIAGAVSFILSFFSTYIRISLDGANTMPGMDFSAGSSAWTSYATLGILLVIAATAIVAVKAFATESLPAGIPWNLAALAAAGLGTFLIIIRAFTIGGGGSGVNVGPGWSGWLLFLSTIALTAFTALSFKASGEKVTEIGKDKPAT